MLQLTWYQQVILDSQFNFFFCITGRWHTPIYATQTTPSESCLSSSLQLRSLNTHLSCIHLILIPVEDIAQSSELLSNTSAYIINISPNLPPKYCRNIMKINPRFPDPPPLSYLLLSPSSTPSSVHSSEGWERRINTLPSKSTLGMTDGQMQEGRKGGGVRLKEKKSEIS